MMTISELPPRKAVRPSARASAGHSGARSNAAFTTPIFRHTPARRSQKRVALELQRHRHHSPHLAADLSCGPHSAKSP